MNEKPWWELWPEVFTRETAALDAAGFVWRRDETAFQQGMLRLELKVETAAGNQELFIIYPDAYPYFRCQVYAPGLDLPFHQHPFERNLCLLGRRTHYWDTTTTAAELILKQLPKLLLSASATDPAAVAGVEEPNAEPISDFYSYPPSMILVQSDWVVGPEHRRGTLIIGTVIGTEQLPNPVIRGAVLEVRSDADDVLCKVNPSMRRAFSGKEFQGRWARVNAPIRIRHEGEFIQELLRQQPQLEDARPNHVKDGWLRVWGVLFPEQTAHRVVGEGWIFACAVDTKRPNVKKVPPPHFGKYQEKNQNRKKGRQR